MMEGIGALLVVVFAIFIYFLPAVSATSRGHPNAGAIFALNLFLGWTFVGWVAALVWSLTSTNQAKPAATDPATYAELPMARDRPRERPCPHCAETILAAAKVCKHCGRDVAPTEKICTNCDRAIPVGDGFCPFCKSLQKVPG